LLGSTVAIRIRYPWIQEMNISYGEDFLRCQEIKERLAAGEDAIPQGDCITFKQAILDAINSGSL